MKRIILLIAFLLISTTVHAQSTVLRWEKSGRDSWENHVDAIPDWLWKAQMDAYVDQGIMISSGTDYQLVLPVMETWAAGLNWFVFGNNILAETSDSLTIRNSTLYGYTITRTDTISTVPTIAQYQIITWDKRTRRKTKSTPPLAIGKTDAYFVALYPQQGWVSAARRVQKVKTRRLRNTATITDSRELGVSYTDGSH
jgi:hypothetical protein